MATLEALYPEQMTNNTYNGWANYETWNASLWIQNDRFLYNTAQACVTYCAEGDTPYACFVRCMDNCARTMTGDDVAWNDPAIDVNEMNEMMADL